MIAEFMRVFYKKFNTKLSSFVLLLYSSEMVIANKVFIMIEKGRLAYLSLYSQKHRDFSMNFFDASVETPLNIPKPS